MTNLLTVEDLVERLADLLGVYGVVEGEHADTCQCRICFANEWVTLIRSTRTRISEGADPSPVATPNTAHDYAAEIDALRARVEALEATLRPCELSGCGCKRRITREDFVDMTISQALRAIALAHGGVLVTRDAIAILTKAGVFPTKGAANDNIHTTIRRSGCFRRLRSGVYQLCNDDPV